MSAGRKLPNVPFEKSPVFVTPGLPGHALEGRAARLLADAAPLGGREGAVIRLGEIVMILELHRQGVSLSAIARQLGIDRKTVRKHSAAGLTAPSYKARPPRERAIASFEPYLRERLAAYPALSGRGLWREIKDHGICGRLHYDQPAA